jgi:hypothetical protein
MRSLSEKQRELLEIHLSKTRIRYVELYDEVYDHYASAYEQGNEEFENVLNNLHQQFTFEYIDANENCLTKKIFKNIRSIYKKEMISFLKWPKIIISVLSTIFLIVLASVMPATTFTYYILFPCMIFSVIPSGYYFIQEHRKLVKRNLKSASLEAMNKVLFLPCLLFQTFVFLSGISFDGFNITENPIFLGVLFIIVLPFNIITIDVYKQKIKYQLA